MHEAACMQQAVPAPPWVVRCVPRPTPPPSAAGDAQQAAERIIGPKTRNYRENRVFGPMMRLPKPPPVHRLASNSAPASCRNVSRETFVRTYLATNLPAIPSLGLFFMQRNVLAVAKKLRIRKDSCDSGAHRAQKRESDLQCSGVMREVAFQRVRGSRRNFQIRYLFAMRNAVECTGRERGGMRPVLERRAQPLPDRPTMLQDCSLSNLARTLH